MAKNIELARSARPGLTNKIIIIIILKKQYLTLMHFFFSQSELISNSVHKMKQTNPLARPKS